MAARFGHGPMSDLSPLFGERAEVKISGASGPLRTKCGGSLLTALSWHLQRPTASAERASTTKHA